MIQFQSYPIFINDYDLMESDRQKVRDIAVDGKRYDEMLWIDGSGSEMFEIKEEKNKNHQSHRSRVYEEGVEAQLKNIYQTAIGKFLFDSLNRSQKIWILPKKGNYSSECNCTADTFPGDPKAGGGILIHYEPTDIKNLNTPADILFHEMVHAYRMGRVGYNSAPTTLSTFGGDYEEFFALIMQNVYLAYTGSNSFRLSYSKYNVWEPIKYAYRSIEDDPIAFKALAYFMDNEFNFINQIARWKTPLYNPFRDFKHIKNQNLRYQIW